MGINAENTAKIIGAYATPTPGIKAPGADGSSPVAAARRAKHLNFEGPSWKFSFAGLPNYKAPVVRDDCNAAELLGVDVPGAIYDAMA